MSENWNSYFRREGDALLSTMLNMSIASDPPCAKYPQMVWIRVYMLQPRPDGLPSQDEFEDLNHIFDALEAAAAIAKSILVGRASGSGRQDYFFYTSDSDHLRSAAAAALHAFPAYRHETGGKADPEWGLYFEMLYPTPAERQIMGNRDVCENLRRHGDTLETPRLIDHCAYFKDELARQRFANHIAAKGFKIIDQFTSDAGDAFALVFSRVGVPESIDDIVLPILDEVMSFGGDYDGWETLVIKSTSGGQA